MKSSFTRRTAVLALAAALVLSSSASALFGGKTEQPEAEEGAPQAQDLEVKTRRRRERRTHLLPGGPAQKGRSGH